jgi:sulfite exporter TauE/SafE
VAPTSLERLKASAPPSPPTAAPLEVLKPAASALKPAARPLEVLQPPESKPAPVMHPKLLAERVIREACRANDPNTFSHWLNQSPEFWSLQVKQATEQLLLQQLLREPQPMAAASLDTLLRFFDLDHVLSGVNPVALEQLRNKQALQWEMLHDHAAMARRLRILTDKGFPHTLRVRDCMDMLQQPRSWRQTFTTALTRNKSVHLARIVYALCNGQFTALPHVIDREHARFWFCAAGITSFNRERLTVSAIRAFSIALACAGGMTVLTVLTSLLNGYIPSDGWQGAGKVFLCLFFGILLIWAALSSATWLDLWQGLPETAQLRKPWLHRLFIPAMTALGLGMDYAGNAPIAASIVTWGTLVVALRRFTYRTPKRTKNSAIKLSPRVITYLLLGGAFGIGNVVNQASTGVFDNVPVLGLVAGATLFIWGLDMWRHRAHLYTKRARA